jgi:hypothetical protein
MDQDQSIPMSDCMRSSIKLIAEQLMTLTDIAVSLDSITTELQETNRNLYDMDTKLFTIATRIEQLENS